MHKTEGADNVAGLFADGPPGTVVEDDWLNAVQNELRNVIEGGGLTLKTAATETGNQLLEALKAFVAARNIITYTSGVNHYSKPAGLAFIKVTVTGGGGGGGGIAGAGAGDFSSGSGGGGGGTSIKIILASSLATSETATVGAGGNGGAAGANNGINGNTSIFGAHCQGNGGVPGGGYTAGTAQKAGYENSGGVGVGGDLNFYGNNSTKPVMLGIASEQSCSGGGGGSNFGGGGVARVNSGAGVAAVAGSGGGGSGACNAGTAATDYAGGNGGSGRITIEEYF